MMPGKYGRAWLVGAMLLAACGGRVNGPGAPSESSGGGNGGLGTNANRRGATAGSATGGSARGGSSSASSGSPAGADADGGAGSNGRSSESAGGAGSGGRSSESAGGAGVGAGDATGTGSGGARALGPPTEVWVGQVAREVTMQEYVAQPRPEHVVLVLITNQSGTSGSIVFGDREPPPAATDPSAFYPPLGSFEPLFYDALIEVPFNGFPYTLLDLELKDGRLTASVAPGELWHDWCALQPKSKYPAMYAGYVCGGAYEQPIDTSQGSDPSPPDMQVLCGGRYTGAPICDCDLASCRANLDAYRWRLDLALRDGAYEGEFAASHGDIGGVWAPGVRLRRVQ